ncbi:MAG: outer membrane protein assembly factor BamD, partial [Myxococcales bacterium]|nr:outer membrane protein assembly factor BamD [Myxococcales bacterium]
TRNSADLGIEIKALREQIARLEGEIAELKNQNTELSASLSSRIDQFARKAGVDVPIDPSLIPSDVNQHFTAAQRALASGDHSTGRGLMREFIKRYPTDPRAGDAQFAVGKSYADQAQWSYALREFNTVLQQYGTSDSADDALLALADAFWSLGSCKDADTALTAFLKKFPQSPLAKTAKAKQKDWKKPPAGHCKD